MLFINQQNNKAYKVQEKDSNSSESTDPEKWYLRILDKSIFGPVDIETLCRWVNQARIIPGHHISSDRKKWIPVETVVFTWHHYDMAPL
jgi:hypothetical protein